MTCNQFWWECSEGACACELFPAGVPKMETGGEEEPQYHALSGDSHGSVHGRVAMNDLLANRTETTEGEAALQSPLETPSPADLDEVWTTIVRRYSRCNLTYSSDKLPALSGLAQNFSMVRGSDFPLDGNSYLAGIWRSHLPYALCWFQDIFRSEDVELRRYRPDPYRAPSWSWASVEGAVRSVPSGIPAAFVVDAKVLPEKEEYAAGMVKGGVLHLRSRIIGPATLDRSSPIKSMILSSSIDGRVREAMRHIQEEWLINWDESDFDDQDKRSFFISYLDQLPPTVLKDGIVHGTGAVRKKVRVEEVANNPCIRLSIVPVLIDEDSSDDLLDITGLVLCQVVDSPGVESFDGCGIFQRVGYFFDMMVQKDVLDLVPERTIAII